MLYKNLTFPFRIVVFKATMPNERKGEVNAGKEKAKLLGSYKMDVQIPYRFHPKV